MADERKFDFGEFVSSLKKRPLDEQKKRVREETEQVKELTVRESTRKFQQQIYLRRLERLSRFLAGENVLAELTPSELQAYSLLAPPPQPAGAAASAVTDAPAAAAAASAPAAEEETQETKVIADAERRQTRRIAMKTRTRVRRDGSDSSEVVAPTNVSRGGLAFDSREKYELHDILWTIMHYREEAGGLEQRAIVVRAAPGPDPRPGSYGVKFLPE